MSTTARRPETETRGFLAAELRAEKKDDGKSVITGYAAVYDSLSEDLGGFRERIAPGAFSRSLKAGADVRALINHDPSLVIGRSAAGTLKITPNGKGLLCTIEPPDTQAGRDLVVSVSRGDIDGMSFAFTTPSGGDSWEMLPNNAGAIRTLLDVDILDVSVVTYPAYRATDVSVAQRSLESVRTAAAPPVEQRALNAAGEVSLEERCGIVYRALRAVLGDPWYAEPYWCVCATFDASVVIQSGPKYLSYSLTWSGKDVALGTPAEVEQHFRAEMDAA